MNKWTAVDLFCGAGGVTTGLLESDCIEVKVAVNHSEEAIHAHKTNHPGIVHLTEDITEVDRILPHIPVVDLLWASAECTNYSKAKGGQSRNPDSRSLPEYLYQYVEKSQCKVFIVENVREFKEWGPLVHKENKKGEKLYNKDGSPKYHPDPKSRGIYYQRWIRKIKKLGYEYKTWDLNAADFGAHTSRIRYFGVFARPDMEITRPVQTHAKDPRGTELEKWKACREVLDLDNEGTSIFGRKYNTDLKPHLRRPLADATLARIAYGIKKYVLPTMDDMFIAKSYSNGGQWSDINEPLHSVTTKDRHAKVKVEKDAFITQHMHGSDNARSVDQVMPTILTKDEKAMISIDKECFLAYQQWGKNGANQVSGDDEPMKTILTKKREQKVDVILGKQSSGKENVQDVEKPCPTILTKGAHSLYFINKKQGNKYNVESIDDPKQTITTNPADALISIETDEVRDAIKEEKIQFILKHFSGSNVAHSINDPLKAICTVNKNTVMTVEMIDKAIKDIKMRYLTSKELAMATGFPEDYYLGGSETTKKKHIGNAVPPIVVKALAGAQYYANQNSAVA